MISITYQGFLFVTQGRSLSWRLNGFSRGDIDDRLRPFLLNIGQYITGSRAVGADLYHRKNAWRGTPMDDAARITCITLPDVASRIFGIQVRPENYQFRKEKGLC